MVWPVQTHPAQSTGPESKRNSGDGEYFSLDFSFYRTALPEKWTCGDNMRRPRHSSGVPTSGPLSEAACCILLKISYDPEAPTRQVDDYGVPPF